MASSRLVALAATILLHAATIPAQNCTMTSVGIQPLNDLGAGLYQGSQGGLYPAGANLPPAGHAQDGLTSAARIQPLGPTGTPQANGRIGLVSIGMSNATQEFDTWLGVSDSDPLRNPALSVVDCAQPGQDAVAIATPTASYWTFVDSRLSAAGITASQVQVAWLKEAVARPTGSFPQSAQALQALLVSIVQIMKARFPNLEICYLSSRIYAGYATINLNPEPHAYESGFAAKWLIEQQISGDATLNHRPENGPVLAPWLAWGPYLWADGLTMRSDGLRWRCVDLEADGTHPSLTGQFKVASLLDRHFTTDPSATPWYSGTANKPRAELIGYGQGCAAGSGPLAPVANSTPFLGNAQFDYGFTGGPPNSSGVLFWGAASASIPLDGCVIHISPNQAIAVPFQTAPSGGFQFFLEIPPDLVLIGASLYTQWLVLDPTATGLPSLGGAAMSTGVELVIGLY